MVAQKTQENDAVQAIRNARSKAEKFQDIKFGLLLLLYALLIHGLAKILSNALDISTLETYEKFIAPLWFHIQLVVIYTFIAIAFYVIERCFRPCHPRLFDCICKALGWILVLFVDLLVSFKMILFTAW